MSDRVEMLEANRLLIEGHTDATPFSKGDDYTNWELSADRANSARRLLQQGRVGPNQISQVRGYGDQMLRVPSNPLDPSNRRVSLIVQWLDASSPAAGGAVSKLPGEVQSDSLGNSTKPEGSSADTPPLAKSVAAVSKPTWADWFKAAIPGKKVALPNYTLSQPHLPVHSRSTIAQNRRNVEVEESV